MKIPYLFVFTLILYSCDTSTSEQNAKTEINDMNIVPVEAVNLSSAIADSLVLDEYFVDSTTIGNKGLNKLEAKLYKAPTNYFVHIDFYTKSYGHWIKKNFFKFKKDRLSSMDPNISDYNKDGFLDFTYTGTIGARLSNDVRRLFVYNHVGDSLVLIKNSLDYPNMVYNERLDCVDAILLHGCSSQAFLKVEGDSLIDFAWIQLGEGVSVYEVDRQGNEKQLYNSKTNEYDCFTRFESYEPLIEYENYPE